MHHWIKDARLSMDARRKSRQGGKNMASSVPLSFDLEKCHSSSQVMEEVICEVDGWIEDLDSLAGSSVTKEDKDKEINSESKPPRGLISKNIASQVQFFDSKQCELSAEDVKPHIYHWFPATAVRQTSSDIDQEEDVDVKPVIQQFPEVPMEETSSHSSQEIKDTEPLIQSEKSPEFILPCHIGDVAIAQTSNHGKVKKESILTPYSPPDSTTSKSLSSLPASKNWKGPYDFSVDFQCLDNPKRKEPYIYSKVKDKLYVSKDVACAVRFSTKKKVPQGATIRTMAIFSQSTENVKRCVSHSLADAAKGLSAHEHLIRSGYNQAVYEENPLTGRHSVIVPYENPQDGQEYSAYVYKFMCLSSCVGGLDRRPIVVIFNLELGDQVLGRRALEVRICACPQRDMKLDERNFHKGEESGLNKRKLNMSDLCRNEATVMRSSKQQKPGTSVGYSIRVQDFKLYQFLNEMKHFYELGQLNNSLHPVLKSGNGEER